MNPGYRINKKMLDPGTQNLKSMQIILQHSNVQYYLHDTNRIVDVTFLRFRQCKS